MKVGILGGSFDPIHFGHLRAAENAREALGLDRSALHSRRPAAPQAREMPALAARDRLAMVTLATAGQPRVPRLPTWSCERAGPSYTVDTLKAVRAERPGDELFLVVGSDTLPEMSSWYASRSASSRSARWRWRPPGGAARAKAPAGARWSTLPGPGLEAERHRRAPARARGEERALPRARDAVADYIAKRGLYR